MLVSPGVLIKEKDMTLAVQNVSGTTGGIAGRFKNGPINVPYLISSENDLVSVFGAPDEDNFPEWFATAEFLKYSGATYVVRAAASDTSSSTHIDGGTIVFKTQDDFEDKVQQDTAITGGTYGLWASKMPGKIGNTLGVIATDAGNWNAFTSWAAASKSFYGTDLSSIFSQPPRTSPWLQDKLVFGSGAKFNVTTSGGAVSGLTIASGGANYKAGAYIEFNGAGSGATANITVSNGVITKITVTNGGTGYTSAPTVAVSGGTGAILTAVTADNKVTGITVTNGGSGFTINSVVSFTGGGGTGAAAIVANDGIANGVITAAAIATGGTGYGTQMVTATAFNPSINDELHIIVLDTDGAVSGKPGTILEAYEGVSKLTDAKNTFNTDNYYQTVINNNSKYIYWLKSPAVKEYDDTPLESYDVVSNSSTDATGTYLLAWDQKATTVIDKLVATEYYRFRTFANKFNVNQLSGGSDGSTVTDGDIKTGYSLLANVDLYDVACFPTAGFSVDVIKHVVENVASLRKDALAFVSPYNVYDSDLSTNKYVLLKNANQVVEFKQTTLAIADQYAQYAVMDSGWKYIFDQYNNKYRWVPLNGDIAGIVARLELVSEPWFSPGGYDRGGVKNALKLSWNPSQAERDVIYPKGINPVVVLPSGGGTILYGDRTMTNKPSAFDRVNVRRLFNILEKSIGQMAKYKLFEINDSFTRSDFKAKVDNYLRDIQSRRGITDFLVVCDASINTGEVIDRNEFRANIFIKPSRSINFITLSFVAVSTSVAFNTVIGV